MPSCFCTITKPFWLLLLVLFSTVGGIVLYLTRSPETSPYASVTEALSVNGIPENFARAETVRKFVFPEDAGPHPDFQTEWWYYTGNLDDGAGHHFGYQLTFFRRAVAAEAPKRPSRWGTRQVYFAHFAVTDVAENRFYSFERFSRGSTGLAGARARPYSVWLENWRAFDREGKTHLVAQEKNVSLKLTLSPQKPIALHGDQGLSPKSLEKGNASYYYSQTRIETTGRIKIGSNSHQVQGSSWLDREWSTSTLGRNQSGWDWFSIQLDDGREIMLFQIRQNDGTTNSFSSGSLVDAKGAVQRLKKGDFEIQVLDRWRSPDTKALYPSGWRIGIPGKEMELTVVPYIKNQEHHHSFAYWEGAVKAEGKNLSGFGYVELTGYLPPSR